MRGGVNSFLFAKWRPVRRPPPSGEMPDVIFVDRKVLAIEKLISVKPERTS
jgi:hypothetical protein